MTALSVMDMIHTGFYGLKQYFGLNISQTELLSNPTCHQHTVDNIREEDHKENEDKIYLENLAFCGVSRACSILVADPTV